MCRMVIKTTSIIRYYPELEFRIMARIETRRVEKELEKASNAGDLEIRHPLLLGEAGK